MASNKDKEFEIDEKEIFDSKSAQAVERINTGKQKLTVGIRKNSSVIMSVLLIVVIVVVYIADMKITTAAALKDVTLSMIILFFCTYAMYFNQKQQGIATGKETEMYQDVLKDFDDTYAELEKAGALSKAQDFCNEYVADELKNVRETILKGSGITYEDYAANYLAKTKSELKKLGLKGGRLRTVLSANRLKPMKLTPDMFMKCGRVISTKRKAMGVAPSKREGLKDISKGLTAAVFAILGGNIFFDIIAAPTWGVIVSCVIKIVLVLWSGFMGYKWGYNHITRYTVNYVRDQIDYLELLERYCDKNK